MTSTTPSAANMKETQKSLTSALVRLLFIVSFIPFVLFAGLVYFRMRTVLLNANAQASQLTNLSIFILGLLIVGALILYALLTWGVKNFTLPLQSIADTMRLFAGGDWTQRVNITRDDEMGAIANSFNHIASQMGETHQSLEKKVDERARQIRTAAEVAHSFTSVFNLDEVLNKTTKLLVKEFGFYQASIFTIENDSKYVDFKSGDGPAAQTFSDQRYRVEIGSSSIIGWVAAKNTPRFVADIYEDPLYVKNDLLPETKAEACVPISLGELVLGVVDVQSTQSGAFSNDTVSILQTLASQIAAAIQTSGLMQASQINFQEVERLYRSSRLIAEAKNEDEILKVTSQILGTIPHPVIIFKAKQDKLQIFSSTDATQKMTQIEDLPASININSLELNDYLIRGNTSATLSDSTTPRALKELLRNLGLVGAMFLPVKKKGLLTALIMIGSRQQPLSNASVQLYGGLVDLMSVALEKVDAILETNKHLKEVEALASINELILSASDLKSFYQDLLVKIQQIIGDYNLVVALYDEKSNSISIPFGYEDGQVISIDSFPLGEGLTSILLRTQKPLMLVEDTQQKLEAMGGKVVGKVPKSWLGAPMMIQNRVIGALIIQDSEREHAFDEDDLKFFNTLAGQVAGVIQNASILSESQHRALQLETAAEIAKDVSGSLDLDELLLKTVSLIRERFDFYHAAIFLLDLPAEFAVIREATGEAGAQMKRAGYKIGVGSKSIVGFVSGRGEPLVVNDTAKDATYFANPLLPDTHAEAGLPLRVGERILGVLDVQSTKPFAFTEDNLRSLQILGDQLAVAVANTELFAETQEHLSQHRLLHHITSTAASGSTLEEALESAVKGLQVTLGGDRVTILLVDREKKRLEVKAAIGYAEDISDANVEIGKGVTGWVAAHKRLLRIRDVNEDPRYIKASSNTRSELAIPLIYRNELLGVLNVESEQVDAYTENDEEMLGTLGGSLAAIIANARLIEQIRSQSERERIVYEVSSKIRRSTDIQSILMTTASEISRITGSQFTKIEVKPTENGEAKDSK